MGTNWKTEQMQRRQIESRPQHYCDHCSAVRVEDDAVCLDCEIDRPSEGWARLEDSYDPFLGRVLDERYLISKIEGRGGSSTIYRAESFDTRRRLAHSKRFAIKMVKLWHSEKSATEEARARLEREVRAVGMLRNPHIVRVYELLELDQNWIALVMDHVDGQTLEERIDARGPLSVGRACGLMRQVANGLCEAHDVGMIHRDIKPANIMLELLPDGHDFAFLLDFGVVHLEGEAKMTHGFLGTPLFASPEQATSGQIDRRSDIYSLGATFFYMLTGRAPFESERTLEVLEAHVKRTPPTLSQACPERSFPPVLETLMAKMLAKRPEDRPASLYEVLESLHGLQEISVEPGSSAVSTPAQSADLTNQLGVEDSCDGAGPSRSGPSRSGPSRSGPSGSGPSGSGPSEFGQAADRQQQGSRRTLLGQGDVLGAGSTMAFQDRPKTMLGVRHAVEIVPDTGEFDSDEPDQGQVEEDKSEQDRLERQNQEKQAARDGWRRGRDSREISSLRETNPGGFDRPHTQPVQNQPVQNQPVQNRPVQNQPSRDESRAGIAFARSVRQSGACSEKLIAFVDSHNEVWTIGGGQLVPVSTPLSRVCSVSASDAGAFVGLADGNISRVLPDRQGLEPLFRDDDGRAITALAATRSGTSLLAGTADGTLYLGQLDRKYNRWLALHANRGIASISLTPDGGVFAAASVDGFVRVAATDTPGTAIAKLVAGGHVRDMAFCNDGYLLAILLDSGRIPIFQVLDGRQISVLTPDCPTPGSMYFSRENILYGVSSSNGRIARWNLTTGRAADLE
jgi:serine/threonine protein kinase